MTSINLKIDAERLSQAITRFGQAALEARQVARRLADVLPARFRDLRREHGGRHKIAHAERMALTDPRYLQHLDELASLHAEARAARIQYETHMMLFEARRTLRPLLAARRRQQARDPRTP